MSQFWKKVISCFLVLVCLATVAFEKYSVLAASNGDTTSDSPSLSIIVPKQTINHGEQFDVLVKINSQISSRGAEFSLDFDSRLVRVVKVAEGDYYSKPAAASGGSTYFNPGTIDNKAGSISFTAVVMLGAKITAPTGEGTLAIITMEAVTDKVIGTSRLELKDVILVSKDITEIADIMVNSGQITITGAGNNVGSIIEGDITNNIEPKPATLEDEKNRARELGQIRLDSTANTGNSKTADWIGAKLTDSQPIYDLSGEITEYMFSIVNNSRIIGTMYIGRWKNNYKIFEITTTPPVILPLPEKIAMVLYRDIGLDIEPNSVGSPDKIIYTGFGGGLWASYNIEGMAIAVNITPRNEYAVPYVNLKASQLSQELYNNLRAERQDWFGVSIKATFIPKPFSTISMTLSKAPALNETFDLECTVTSVDADLINTPVEVKLPAGFEYVSGDLNWFGNITKGESLKIKATVKTVKTGDWQIEASCPGANADRIFLLIGDKTSIMSHDPIQITKDQNSTIGGQLKALTPEANYGAGIVVTIGLNPVPELGETGQLTCTLQAAPGSTPESRKNILAEIILPDGLSYVSGDKMWYGDIPPAASIELKTTIQAVKMGTWHPGLKTSFTLGPSVTNQNGTNYQVRPYYIFRVDDAWVKIENNSAEILNDLPSQGVVAPNIYSEAAKSGSIPLNTLSNLEISGRIWSYITENTLQTNDELHPTIWGEVEVYDGNNNLLGSQLSQGYGPNCGNFYITVNNPGDTGFYIIWKPESNACLVKPYGLNAEYTSRSPAPGYVYVYNGSACTVGDLYIDFQNENMKGAWRIYSSLVEDYYNRGAWNFLVNGSIGPHWMPPQAKVEFPHSPGQLSCYDPIFDVINIKTTDDSKGIDVVQHEFSHFTMDLTTGWGWQGPFWTEWTHYINQTSNPPTAWAEGWAEFLPMVIQSAADNPPSPWIFQGIDLEVPAWNYASWDNGQGCEGRVAGSLWDLYDTVNDGWDTYSGPFMEIWNTFVHQHYESFNEFWAHWQGNSNTITQRDPVLMQNTIVPVGCPDWDVNGNGVCNSTDAGIIGVYWGQSGLPGWLRADVNKNGIINSTDLGIIGMHWNEKWS